MPLIQVKLIAEVSTPEQKRQMITALIEAMVRIDARARAGFPGLRSKKSAGVIGALAGELSRPKPCRLWAKDAKGDR